MTIKRSSLSLDDPSETLALGTNLTQTPKRELSIEEAERIASNALYGGEKPAQLRTDLPNIQGIEYLEQITTNDASSIGDWEGNPRMSESGAVENEELRNSLIQANGNTIPAFVWDNPETNKREVIAGSCRRRYCAEESLPFTYHLIKCSIETAFLLTETENHGRKDTSFIANCRWHLKEFTAISNSKLTAGERYTQHMYAVRHNINLTTIQDYFSFARFPSWLLAGVEDQHSISYRACNELRKMLAKDEATLRERVEGEKFRKVRDLLNAVKPSEPNQGKRSTLRNQYKQLEVEGQKDAAIFFATPKGTEIHLSNAIPQSILQKIEALLSGKEA